MRFAALALLLASAAQAAIDLPLLVQEQGVTLRLPAGWEVTPRQMDNVLVARPGMADRTGWASDLLIVNREAYDARRTCLDGYVLRKLEGLAFLTAPFRKLAEEPVNAGRHAATLLEVEGTEGPRLLHRYLLVIATPRAMVNVSLASEPSRFELQRAAFRQIIESARVR